MIKKLLATALSVTLGMTSLAACAAENEDLTIVLQINNPTMTVNGVDKSIDDEGTTPVILNERTLLPVRAVVEEIGGTVGWNGDTKEVTLTYGADAITLTIDSTAAYLNGTLNTLDTAPTIINERTMLPIRFIAESFGFDVVWEQSEQLVTISKNNNKNMTADNTISSSLVLIDGGTFKMGSQSDEPERTDDEILHEVTVDSFYIAKTELTQKEYQSLMGNNPSENQGDNLPVENVTWYDAIQYCNKLSVSEGLTPCYTISSNSVTWDKSADGYRLPTEAEWEYAARAKTDTPFSFGDYVDDEDANCYNAYGYNCDASGTWVNGYLQHTVRVDSYAANGYGLYNMHGNVAEWVWDWYSDYSIENTSNPTGPDSGNYKIARGGGWNDFPKHIRSAYRSAFPADVPLYSIGIRPVRSAVTSQENVTSVDTSKSSDTAENVLIVYFSQTGNTDGFAEIIEEMTGADIFRIERAQDYSATHNSQGLYAEALTEQRENAIPDLKVYLEDSGIDIDNYDTILLGYCNWWASVPASVRTFLMRYDLSGKTIVPFCSMGGGRFGQTISAVAKLAPNSTIKKGLDVSYSSYDRDAIASWLTASGINTLN
jgi:formylglycine-generating enzyme required for sulfatase activity/flavodoxin